jgi:hypothetical protein
MKQEHRDNFEQLCALHDDGPAELRRQRGLIFEKLINDIVEDEGVLLRRGFHTKDHRSEQIDGAVDIYGRIFLLEMKWVKSDLAASELYAFIGKIENKFHGTLGIFVSRNELTENFISALNKGRRQSVIVIHGKDLDEIFKSEFSFKDYITHVVKLLSYDNIVHYPVSKYLETKVIPATDTPAADVVNEARLFITEKLLSTLLDKDLLQAELELGNKTTFNVVYNYVLNQYYKVLQDSRKTFDMTKRQNFRSFIELYQTDHTTMMKQAGNFYNTLIPAHFEEYASEPFITLFTPYFKALKPSLKTNFEAFTVKKFGEINQWDDENRMTELLQPLWKILSPEARKALSSFYLDIFITDRQDKFAQKSFANKLVASGDIDTAQINEWLDTKLAEALKAYSGPASEERIRFIASTYWPVGKHLGVEIKNWVAFITDKIAGIVKK